LHKFGAKVWHRLSLLHDKEKKNKKKTLFLENAKKKQAQVIALPPHTVSFS